MKYQAALCGAVFVCISIGLSGHCRSDESSIKPHGKDHASSLHSHPDAKPIELPARYLEAVNNAKTATSKDVSQSLTAIVRGNGQLIWRKDVDSPQVLVATWTTHKSYYPKPGTTFTENYSVWVTVAPQLRKFCAKYQPRERNDWGNVDSRVGLSEFVIRKDASLTVHSVSTTEGYRRLVP